MKSFSNRTLVVGLDGVSTSLIRRYVSGGIMPRLGGILASGFHLEQMDASIPDISSTSWTSFMTGVNPGEHGIYGFTGLQKGSYRLTFATSRDIKAPAIWEILDGTVNGRDSSLYAAYRERVPRSLKSVVMNVPQTYPALPMNGILTAGFVCPDMKKGTYPESAYEYLAEIGYKSDVDSKGALADPESFFSDLFQTLEKRKTAFEHFLSGSGADLFIAVITETDRLNHFYYDAALDESHPYHASFTDFYGKVDGIIGSLYDRFMEQTNGEGFFMTLSDHGFTTVKREVNLNAWLQEHGYLSLGVAGEYYERMEAGSRAFAMDPGRIYLHAEGKYPRGFVREGEEAGLVDEIRSALRDLSSEDGEPIIKEILEKNQVYHGQCYESAPDLVCIANDGFDLKGGLKKQEIFSAPQFRGMHTRHDAHCILPHALAVTGRLKIEDIAGIILNRYVH